MFSTIQQRSAGESTNREHRELKRICLLHIGTHKTGSTALQLFLANNRDRLLNAGILVPATGVRTDIPVGHHKLSAMLRSPNARVLIEELLGEMRDIMAPLTVISSEEFDSMSADPEGIQCLIDELRAEYDVRVLVYLRRQDDFAESLYGERLRGSPTGLAFSDYIQATLRLGGFSGDSKVLTIPFDYNALLAPFRSACESGAVIARPYAGRNDSLAIYRDFIDVLRSVFPPLVDVSSNLRVTQRSANESYALIGLLSALHVGIHGKACIHDIMSDILKVSGNIDRAVMTGRFELLCREEVLSFVERFGPSNVELERTYGIKVHLVSEQDVLPLEHPRWRTALEQRRVVDSMIEIWSSTDPQHP